MSSRYAQFIVANSALFVCMESTTSEQYATMSASAQAEVCKAETHAVQQVLQNNDCSFGNLLNTRIENLSNTMWEMGIDVADKTQPRPDMI